MSTHVYEGEELDLFAKAHRWKSYWSSEIRSYLGESILEVGAGIGTNTALLAPYAGKRWVCLEPDPQLAGRIGPLGLETSAGEPVEVIVGAVENLPADVQFDTALYIDVLEHIERDSEELARVAVHLRPGGVLIILAPAHPALYSEFDAAVGHYRRYTKSSLANVVPAGAACLRLGYLDTAGVLASMANRALLRRALPNASQIRMWDSVLVPLSRRLDPLLGGRVGKSVLGVWRMGST